jgi:hypothetical protein
MFTNASLTAKPESALVDGHPLTVAPAARMVDTDGMQGSRRSVAPDPATP